MRKNIFFIIVLLFVITSCATVDFYNIKNEEKNISGIKGYLIQFDIEDMKLRNSLETELVKRISNNGKKAKESILLFPPIREYTAVEIMEKCIAENLNAKILITLENVENEKAFMFMYGILMPVSTSNYTFDMKIIDINGNQIIIHSTIKTEGDSLKYICSQLSKKIVNELLKEEEKETLKEQGI